MNRVTANGAEIPALGFGTYRISEPDIARILPDALRVGFRHIDTATYYENEAAIGEVLKASGVSRAELFITTKVWPTDYPRAVFKRSVEASLAKLQTDYVDLLLLHWPKTTEPLAEVVESLNAAADAGQTRFVGISNFSTWLMEEVAGLSRHPIVTNQVEYHPFLSQGKVIAAARQRGISVTSYHGMAEGQVFDVPTLKDIAARHGKSVAQVVLRWLVQQVDVIALSKTINAARLGENFAIFDFALSEEEMASVFGLARPGGRIVDPKAVAEKWDD